MVRGAGLENVTKLVFRGKVDDVTVRSREAHAPLRGGRGARQGEQRAAHADRPLGGNDATTRFKVRVRDAPKPKPLDLSPESHYFYAGRRRPTYAVEASAHVELLSESTGEVVRSWDVQGAPGQPAEVRWDGKGSAGVGSTGAYRFRSAGANAAAVGEESRFFFGDHLFPIRGRHNLGWSETNNFGGGRGHQGQDMFARCGTRLALARGERSSSPAITARLATTWWWTPPAAASTTSTCT